MARLRPTISADKKKYVNEITSDENVRNANLAREKEDKNQKTEKHSRMVPNGRTLCNHINIRAEAEKREIT